MFLAKSKQVKSCVDYDYHKRLVLFIVIFHDNMCTLIRLFD